MNIDKAIFLLINQFAGRYFYLDFFFYFFAVLLPYLIIFFLIFFFLRNIKKNGWLAGEALFAGFFARYALIEVLRYFFPRIRPFQAIEEANLLLPYKESLSFPSGHTAFLFAISTVVFFYNKKAGIFLYIVSFIGGGARIFTGIHWPADIFAGALVGVFTGLLINGIANVIKRKLGK